MVVELFWGFMESELLKKLEAPKAEASTPKESMRIQAVANSKILGPQPKTTETQSRNKPPLCAKP